MTAETSATALGGPPPAGSKPRLVAVVPTHARDSLIERTLDSLIACTPPQDREVQIVVVENGGKHAVETLLRQKVSPYPLIYRHHEQGNKSAALNSVLHEFQDALLVLLDDDVRVDPGLLQHYSAAAGQATEGLFFGGGMLVDYEEPPPSWLARYLPLSAVGWHPAEYTPKGRMSFLGCNWAAFARDILRCGGFDAGFGPGSRTGATGQESDMQFRLKAASVEPQYVRDAVVWHYVPKSRCSPQWALERARRMATASALWMEDKHVAGGLGGVPRWLMRDLAVCLFRVVTTALASQENKFEARFRLNECLGALAGVRRRQGRPGIRA